MASKEFDPIEPEKLNEMMENEWPIKTRFADFALRELIVAVRIHLHIISGVLTFPLVDLH